MTGFPRHRHPDATHFVIIKSSGRPLPVERCGRLLFYDRGPAEPMFRHMYGHDWRRVAMIIYSKRRHILLPREALTVDPDSLDRGEPCTS